MFHQEVLTISREAGYYPHMEAGSLVCGGDHFEVNHDYGVVPEYCWLVRKVNAEVFYTMFSEMLHLNLLSHAREH